jgi:hypothetical protein
MAALWLTAAGAAPGEERRTEVAPPDAAVAGGEAAADSVTPCADDPELVAKIAVLPDRTGLKLPAARPRGKNLEKWRRRFYRNGPVGRDYCVKMVYNPDRNALVVCRGLSVRLYRYARHEAKVGE